MRRSSIATGCLLLWLAVLTGCGSSNEFDTAEVTGVVLYNGKPLDTGSLLFNPVDVQGPSAQGVIKPDGTFALGTYAEDDGAVLGKHKVMIMSVIVPDPNALPEQGRKRGSTDGAPVSLIPDKYGNDATSGLEVEVKSEGNKLKFELTDKEGTVSVVTE